MENNKLVSKQINDSESKTTKKILIFLNQMDSFL